MGYIYYRLNGSANLAGMVPPAMPGGAFGAAALPPGLAGAGMYIIINCQGAAAANHNRYIGISRNLARRFGTRMGVITELGITAATMAQVHVVWGRVKVRNHPLGLGIPTTPTRLAPAGAVVAGPPPTIPFPRWAAPGWTNANPVGGPLIANVDGHNINLEHLLIRFIVMRIQAGGTVSNNMLMGPFAHPAAHGAAGARPLIVKFTSAAFGPYGTHVVADTLNPGFVF